jgi:hypothetical protein
MLEVYEQLYQNWIDAGGKMINSFAHMWPRRFDQFGNLPDQFAVCEDHPKEEAVRRFIVEQPCWWENCEITQP